MARWLSAHNLNIQWFPPSANYTFKVMAFVKWAATVLPPASINRREFISSSCSIGASFKWVRIHAKEVVLSFSVNLIIQNKTIIIGVNESVLEMRNFRCYCSFTLHAGGVVLFQSSRNELRYNLNKTK
ncbi:hypothetical protein WA026_003970 [Henosepilachna vigintioctopunctata]|uniref:Uncharacterized protein n=1 Tax=Henosepilachna vigintioctopunctata TaxID=420089 RepID=A0AAW1UEE6_9CUCU